MARPLRIEYEGAFYHITSRGNERKSIFFTPRDYDKFKEYLEDGKKKFNFLIHCYVLMSNHYHLLLETHEKNLHRIMHYVNSSYSTYTNRKRRRSGHLFQGRYKSIVVDKDSYLLELSRYMHLNPVRAKMVSKPEEYPHSSYRSYIEGKEDQIVHKADLLGYFAGRRVKAQDAYRDFVESVLGMDLESPLNSVYGGGILGDEDFVNEVLANVEEDDLQSEEIAHRKAFSATVHHESVLAGVSKHFGVSVDEVVRKGNDHRKVYVYLLKKYSDTPNRKISELLRLGGPSSAGKIFERFLRDLQSDDRLRQQIEELEVALSLKPRSHG